MFWKNELLLTDISVDCLLSTTKIYFYLGSQASREVRLKFLQRTTVQCMQFDASLITNWKYMPSFYSAQLVCRSTIAEETSRILWGLAIVTLYCVELIT